MKRIFMIPALFVAMAMNSCGGGAESTDETNSDSTATDETVEAVRSEIDPFPEFPMVSLNANEGDIILTPSKNWQVDATAEGADKTTFIFYKQTLASAGEGTSSVNFMGEPGVEIPNYMIIPIKPNQTAKKGDIVLTWWQTGSGMQRAIVTDATDPAAPKVNYLDLSWDNPAKTAEGVGIGQATYQIAAGTFHVLTEEWAPGTTVAVNADGKTVAAKVVCVSGDKVLTIGFAGKMNIYEKSACTPCPVQTNVKVGDDIQVPWVGSFVASKVVKIDAANGRVWCDDPYSDDPMVVAFGDVHTTLAL